VIPEGCAAAQAALRRVSDCPDHQAESKFRNPAPRTFGYWKKRSLFSKGRKYCFFGEPAYDFPHS
jgi:hypothetical protein